MIVTRKVGYRLGKTRSENATEVSRWQYDSSKGKLVVVSAAASAR